MTLGVTTLGALELDGPESCRCRRILSQPKRLALFLYLVLARPRGYQSRERLLGLFWPDSDPKRARAALRQALRYLRRSLGPGVIVNRGRDEVGITVDRVRCDAIAFEEAVRDGRLEAALELYRGDLLDGFHVSGGSAEFEHWLEQERVRLRELAVEAAWTLATRRESEGDTHAAVQWARRGAAIAPYAEEMARRLITLLHRTGDAPAALAAFDAFAVRVREAYGTTPTEETTELAEGIRRALQAEIAPAKQPDAVPPAPPADLDVSATVADPTPTTVTHGAETHPAGAPRGEGDVRTGRRTGRTGWWVGALGLAAAVVLALLVVLGSDRADGPTRVVVEGFEDYSSDGELGYLAKALTTTLVDQLAPVPTLQVVAADAADGAGQGEGGAPLDLDHAADRLPPTDGSGADLRVRGSVLASAGRLRVNVQLVDAATGAAVETFYVEEPMGELFTLLDEVSGQVSTALRRELGREIRMKRWRAGTDVPEAWDAVQRAQWYRDKAGELRDSRAYRSAAEALETADSLLAVAEERDPDWVAPTVLRGEVARDLGWLYFMPPLRELARYSSYLEEGIRHASRALEKDPDHAAAFELRGVLRHLRFLLTTSDDPERLQRQAERDLRRAVALDPGHAQAWNHLSAILFQRGEFVDARLAAERAYEMDAYLDNPVEILTRLVQTSLEVGDDSAAAAWCHRLRRRFPESWTGARCALMVLALSEGEGAPDPAEAWRIAQNAAVPPHLEPLVVPHLQMLAAGVLARAGLADSAEAVVRRARQGSSDPELLRLEAMVGTFLGQTDSAASLAQAYVRGRPVRRAWVLKSRAFRTLPLSPAPRTEMAADSPAAGDTAPGHRTPGP